MTLKEWCIENNRKDILKEFVCVSVYGTNPQNIIIFRVTLK